MRTYAGTCYYKTPGGAIAEMPVTVRFASDALTIRFPDRPEERWPFTQVSTAAAQGEMPALSRKGRPDLRISLPAPVMQAITAASHGQPYRLPRRMPFVPLAVLALLAAIFALIRYLPLS